MKVNNLAELKRTIAQIIKDDNIKDFPKTITFIRGIEFPKYKVTIEELEEDFFIDSKGTKWVKVKDDSDMISHKR